MALEAQQHPHEHAEHRARRAFAIDVLACVHCGGRLRLIGTLHDPGAIRKLLAHLGMARSGPSPGPAPPESGAAAL